MDWASMIPTTLLQLAISSIRISLVYGTNISSMIVVMSVTGHVHAVVKTATHVMSVTQPVRHALMIMVQADLMNALHVSVELNQTAMDTVHVTIITKAQLTLVPLSAMKDVQHVPELGNMNVYSVKRTTK